MYEKLKRENDEELETFVKEEEEAAEKAGDTEIQAARGKRAEFWARVGDKVRYCSREKDCIILTRLALGESHRGV